MYKQQTHIQFKGWDFFVVFFQKKPSTCAVTCHVSIALLYSNSAHTVVDLTHFMHVVN